MACATLKRSLDWEAINQRPTKRRRCSPFTGSPSQNQTVANAAKVTVTEPTVSVFSETYPKLTPGTYYITSIHIYSFYKFFFCNRKNGTKYS